jgi:hypothetical protein
MASRYYSAVAQDTTVTSNITSSSTSVTVAAVVGYPSSYPFVLALDYNTASEELVTVTGVSGLTLTITRGYNGTTATAHNAGAVVRHVITAQDLTDAQNHYGTALSAGAHGVTGALATFLGTPTSANFAATVTDETGSGSLVFATGPTIASPTITGTINAGGNTGASGTFLSSTGSGIAWSTPSAATLGFNAQTGTTYTLVASDNAKLVTLSNAAAITLTVPPSVFTSGQQVNIQQIGAGQVSVAAGSGVTITSTGSTVAAPKLRAQYSAATIICTGTNTFTVLGDIS